MRADVCGSTSRPTHLARGTCFDPAWPMHLRHRRVLLAKTPAHRRALGRRIDGLGGVAHRRQTTTFCVDWAGVYTAAFGGALAVFVGDHHRRRERWTAEPPRTATGVLCVPALPGWQTSGGRNPKHRSDLGNDESTGEGTSCWR